MSLASSAERPGRYLLAAGTASYEHDERLPQVETDLGVMVDLFRGLGYETERLLDPDLQGLKRQVGDWAGSPGRRPDDLLVFYYSGHGAVTVGDRRHYLLARDSNPKEPAATALATEDLARILHEARPRRGTGRVFLILDTCYSGWGAGDLSGVATQLSRTDGLGFYVLACARPKQEAVDGVFAAAFAEAVRDERFGGARQPLIQLGELVHGINRRFEESGRSQSAAYDVHQGSGLFPFLPNPRFRAGLPPGIDLESQARLLQEDLEAHWSPRARGVEIEAREGWYFTGRTAVLRRLVTWLSSRHRDGRARVVTGDPGSGKSAVLGRLVTCSAGGSREALDGAAEGTLPPEGIVDLPIHARGRTEDEIARLMATAAGLKFEGPERLVSDLVGKGGELVVVVDALDEAAEPERIADLLRKTASYVPAVRVLVGTRRTLVGRFGHNATVLDLDRDEFFDERDVEGYVRLRLLEDSGSPYRRGPAQAREAARAVAARAGRSFLLAQVLTRSLVAAKRPARTESARWRATLSSNLKQAFERDLSRFGAETRRVSDLLRPLAWAEGRGLPWADLWAPLASKIAGKRYGDGDLRWLRDRAGAYIVEDQDAGQSVYRLFHREFARYLRQRRREAKVQERIVTALEGTVPRSSAGRLLWPEAHSYVRTHLATHAARCGRLEELLEDPLFLAAADPVRLLAVLPDEPAGRAGEAARLFKLAFHHLRRSRSPGESASFLQLAARQDGEQRLARLIEKQQLDWPWKVLWAKWKQAATHRVLIGHTAKEWRLGAEYSKFDSIVYEISMRRQLRLVHAVAVGRVGDDAVIVSAGHDGTVRLWDGLSCSPRAEPLRGHRREVKCLAIGELGGRPLVVSGGADKSIRIWDMITGTPRGTPLRGHVDEVSALAIGAVSARPVVLSGSYDGTLRVWDLSTGESLGVLDGAHKKGISSLAFGEFEGRPLVASQDLDKGVWVWDLEQMAPAAAVSWSHGQKAKFLGALGSRLVVVRGRKIVGLADGRSHGSCSASSGPVAWGRMQDRSVLVTGGAAIRVWDLEADKTVGSVLRGYGEESEEYGSLALGKVAGQPVVVTGGYDGTVRIWDLPKAGTSARTPRKPRNVPGHGFGVASLRGRTVLVSPTANHLCVWDLANGKLLHRPVKLYRNLEVQGFGVVDVSGGAAVAVGDFGGTVSVWDLESGELLSELDVGDELGSPLVSMAVGTVAGDPLVISGCPGRVVVNDLMARSGGVEMAMALKGHAHPSAVGVGEVGQRAVVFGTEGKTLLMWDVSSSKPKRHELTGHRSEIRSLVFGEIGGKPGLVSGDEAGAIRLWSLSGRQPRVRRRLQAHGDWVTTLAVGELRGASRIVSGGRDGKLCIWRPDGTLEQRLELLSQIRHVAIGPPSRLCVSATAGYLVLDFDQ